MPKKSSRYAVATFEKLPGVSIPLMLDEECKIRGIEPGRFPPFDTWTPEQQAAGRELSKALVEMAVDQSLRAVCRHRDAMQAEGYAGTQLEVDAALRALAELRAGKWNAGKADTSGLEKEMILALEVLLEDGDPSATAPKRKRAARKK
jgi:hypothetical protein